LFSTIEILDIAIGIEQNGEAVYRDALEIISEPQLLDLLTWMADEEVKHARWFSDLKQNVETESTNPFVEEMGRELFNDLLGEKSFSHKEVDFSKVEQIDDLMEIFIEFEKDSILFYELLEPFIEDEGTLENLKQIIAEENNHITRLQDFIGSQTPLSFGFQLSPKDSGDS
jgi:rubrerythrin